jgi:hypothetical protein
MSASNDEYQRRDFWDQPIESKYKELYKIIYSKVEEELRRVWIELITKGESAIHIKKDNNE